MKSINSLVLTYKDKTNTSIPQQINFAESLEEDAGATILLYFLLVKSSK